MVSRGALCAWGLSLLIVSAFPGRIAGTSSTVTLSITGESGLAPDSRIWDIPVSLSESPSFEVAVVPSLNSLGPAPGTSNATKSTPPPSDGGLETWHIALIAGGGGFVLLGVLICICSLTRSRGSVVPTTADLPTWMDSRQTVFPPPHAYSKVIQVKLVHQGSFTG
jgi:hypothetical protein